MKERTEILEETFRKLAEEKKYASLRDLMQTLYPADIATILSDMPERMMPAIFRLLPKDLAAETFVEMESDVKETLMALAVIRLSQVSSGLASIRERIVTVPSR